MPVVPRALLLLRALEYRGVLRRFGRQIRTPGGVLFLLMYSLMMLPALFGLIGWLLFSDESRPALDPATSRLALSAFMLLFTLLSLLVPDTLGRLMFRPAEVDFLFAGPYTRRQLIAHKLIGALAPIPIAAPFISLFMLPLAGSWPALCAGLCLVFAFLHQFGMAYALLLRVIAEHAPAPLKGIAVSLLAKLIGGCAWLLVIALLGPLAYDAYVHFAQGGMLSDEFIQSIVNAPQLNAILAPFRPFAAAVAAESLLGDGLPWVAAALAMNSALFAVILRLDADYMEAAVVSAEKMAARLERLRRGHLLPAPEGRGRKFRTFPPLPRMGGAGPIAWRQLTSAARGPGRMTLLFVVVAVSFGGFANYFGWTEDIPGTGLWMALGLVAYATLFFLQFMRFDFRADIDLMDGLKTMPARPAAIALGQVLGPALMMTIFHLGVVGGIAIAFDQLYLLPITAAVTLPFNVLLVAVENLVYLLAPTRVFATTMMDFSVMWRQFASFMLKLLVLLPCAVAVFTVALITWYLVGGSWPAVAVAANLTTTALAAALIPLVGYAFNHFDPSTDTPP